MPSHPPIQNNFSNPAFLANNRLEVPISNEIETEHVEENPNFAINRHGQQGTSSMPIEQRFPLESLENPRFDVEHPENHLQVSKKQMILNSTRPLEIFKNGIYALSTSGVAHSTQAGQTSHLEPLTLQTAQIFNEPRPNEMYHAFSQQSSGSIFTMNPSIQAAYFMPTESAHEPLNEPQAHEHHVLQDQPEEPTHCSYKEFLEELNDRIKTINSELIDEFSEEVQERLENARDTDMIKFTAIEQAVSYALKDFIKFKVSYGTEQNSLNLPTVISFLLHILPSNSVFDGIREEIRRSSEFTDQKSYSVPIKTALEILNEMLDGCKRGPEEWDHLISPFLEHILS